MNILITGGTGFVGRAIARKLLARGDTVTVFTRDPSSPSVLDGARGAAWDPGRKGDWYREVDDQDAVIHLTGEQAVGKRWTKEVKDRILLSRTVSTGLIVDAIGAAKNKPKVLVSASAVGYYGARGDEPLDESAEGGDDFLALVCRGWEAAARGVEKHGVRTVRARIGIVFGKDGGALAEMVKPFKLMVGGRIGDGRQVVSWIHVDDLTEAFLRFVDDESLRGAFNVTAPNAVANEQLSTAIGKALRRPSFMRAPAFALRLRFGEGADPLLTGQRAVPRALERAGFEWRYSHVEAALEDLLP